MFLAIAATLLLRQRGLGAATGAASGGTVAGNEVQFDPLLAAVPRARGPCGRHRGDAPLSAADPRPRLAGGTAQRLRAGARAPNDRPASERRQPAAPGAAPHGRVRGVLVGPRVEHRSRPADRLVPGGRRRLPRGAGRPGVARAAAGRRRRRRRAVPRGRLHRHDPPGSRAPRASAPPWPSRRWTQGPTTPWSPARPPSLDGRRRCKRSPPRRRARKPNPIPAILSTRLPTGSVHLAVGDTVPAHGRRARS